MLDQLNLLELFQLALSQKGTRTDSQDRHCFTGVGQHVLNTFGGER